MPRIISVIIIWIVFVGGPLVYLIRRVEQEPAHAYKQEALAAEVTVQLTFAFAAQPDPFALTAVKSPPTSVRVSLNGQDILRRNEPVKEGEPIQINDVKGFVKGTNELLVEAFPALDQASQSQALRVWVKRGAETVADQTLWSEPGQPLSATMTIDLGESKEEEAGHDH